MPAAIGLTAFLFLRFVNFRSHRVGTDLRAIAGVAARKLSLSIGMVGFLLATMPLAFGYAISWYLAFGNAARHEALQPLWVVGGAVFSGAVVVHSAVRFLERR
jgi:hypothetical protein